jgi:hypothetical protein
VRECVSMYMSKYKHLSVQLSNSTIKCILYNTISSAFMNISMSTCACVLTASIEFKRSAGSFLRVLSFLGLPAAFSKIVSPSQMTPIAVCPGVREDMGCVRKWSR